MLENNYHEMLKPWAFKDWKVASQSPANSIELRTTFLGFWEPINIYLRVIIDNAEELGV